MFVMFNSKHVCFDLLFIAFLFILMDFQNKFPNSLKKAKLSHIQGRFHLFPSSNINVFFTY